MDDDYLLECEPAERDRVAVNLTVASYMYMTMRATDDSTGFYEIDLYYSAEAPTENFANDACYWVENKEPNRNSTQILINPGDDTTGNSDTSGTIVIEISEE